jgi:RNA polymerase sigma-70 factor (ECF subfamily)
VEVDTTLGVEAGGVDARAALSLCEAHAGTVYRFARMVARSDSEAEDLAHDSLVRVIRGAHRFDPAKGEVGAWLWRLVANTARDHGRLASRGSRLLSILVVGKQTDEAEDPAQIAVGNLEDEVLVRAIRALPKRSRSVIALRYGADLSFQAVARQLGVSESGARMAHHRALSQLRRELGKE